KTVLVVGVESLSKIVNWTDRNTCVLFGDAAGAMVLGPSPDASRGILGIQLHTDGDAAGVLAIPGGGSLHPQSVEVLEKKLNKVAMNGREVYKYAVRALPEAVLEVLGMQGLTPTDVTHLIGHQANLRIIESVCHRLRIPLEKCWVNIHRYGNTSSASLPTTLDEANRAGRLQPGDIIATMAIGAGMAWGAGVIKW
ncbi:MAG TPA: 3-oxoacyl-[acyl-carrier-protein] synthase III C-terminal domain-containing protein, partial [Myxococcaceae bacterium]|nr:3-oxoacyl-[acyl-carrier-protein] synthase III C-terminal domain-containing protein [Myxococcaceae bacterium]